MTHTPGPWEYRPEHLHDGRHIAGRAASVVCNAQKIANMVRWTNKDRDDESEANARLIAAAPELLEALKGILPWIPSSSASEGGPMRSSENIAAADAVRAAIAKAEGKP